jgi:hypothetical protein
MFFSNQDRLFAVVQQRLDHLPQPISRPATALQKFPDRIMADPRQVLGQVTARIVDRRIQQLFDVLLFRHHALDSTPSTVFQKDLTLPEPPKRKPWWF